MSTVCYDFCQLFILIFQLPTAEQWYKFASACLEVIFSEDGEDFDSPLGRVRQILLSHVDIDLRFSESRCAKALPLAFSAYKDGLATHYLSEVHHAKVSERGSGTRPSEKCMLKYQL